MDGLKRMTATCIVCGRSFLADYYGDDCCSLECSRKLDSYNKVCEWCEREIDVTCDEAHEIEADDEPYTICDSCHNTWLVEGKVPAWV